MKIPVIFLCAFFLPRYSLNLLVVRDDVNYGYRLPKNVKPQHYDITINPDLSSSKLSGNVVIVLEIMEATNVIILHSLYLKINNISLFSCDDSLNHKIVSFSLNEELQFLNIKIEEILPQNGIFCLSVDYEGFINNDENYGFYNIFYEEESFLKIVGGTQLSPIFARRVFPCFDEPSFKAEFTIKIKRKQEFFTISNMPLNHTLLTDDDPDNILDVYQRSPKMSTYSVSFTILSNDYDFVNDNLNYFYARKHLIENGRADYPLEIGGKILKILENITGITYSTHMEVLKNVALPKQSQVVESYGLTTYGEGFLLFDPNLTSCSEKELIIENISKSYSKNWFGNLVSPAWWNNLWISEGFSTYFGHFVASKIEPTWKIMDLFTLKSWEKVIGIDSLESTRALTVDEVETPEEILNLFDVISFEKGGLVVKMLKNILGDDVFQSGIKKFLNEKQLDIGTEIDLWNAFQEAVEEYQIDLPFSVKEIMSEWTQKSGFPILTVQIQKEMKQITISQEKFVSFNDSRESNQTWIVPVNFATKSNDFSKTGIDFWLSERTQTFSNVEVLENNWIILNKQLIALYRVNYDESNWMSIKYYLRDENFHNIHPINRAQLIDDSLNLAKAGRLDYDIPLELIEYLPKETHYLPIHNFIKNSRYISLVYRTSYSSFDYLAYVMELLEPLYQKLSVEEESNDQHLDKLMRNELISFLCDMGHEECLQMTNFLLRSRNYISPDLQSSIYCGGLRSGGEEDWNYLFDLYKSEISENNQKERILASLGCNNNVTILQRLVSMAFTFDSDEWKVGTNVEKYIVLRSLFTNSDLGLTLTLSNVISRFTDLAERYSPSQMFAMLDELSSRLIIRTHQQLFLMMVQMLPESLKIRFRSAIEKSLQNLDETNYWIENYQSSLDQWFELRATTISLISTTTENVTTTAIATVSTTSDSFTTIQPVETTENSTTSDSFTTIQPTETTENSTTSDSFTTIQPTETTLVIETTTSESNEKSSNKTSWIILGVFSSLIFLTSLAVIFVFLFFK